MFGGCNEVLMSKLAGVAETGEAVDMETLFCSVSLDIIGKAVFNYPFDSVTKESPIIKVRQALNGSRAQRRESLAAICWPVAGDALCVPKPNSLTLLGAISSLGPTHRRSITCCKRPSTGLSHPFPTGTCLSPTSSSRGFGSSG